MPDAFQFEELDGKIGQLTFDQPERKVNTLSQATFKELAHWVGQLEGRTDLRGLLCRSGKPDQFVAGADIKEIGALAFASKQQVMQAVALGHQVFDRIGRLPFPTVALIDGNCLGGGTELALAMDYRIASSSSQTKIGTPEIKLGILPAWGGTQRLPRVIGLHGDRDDLRRRADLRRQGRRARAGLRRRPRLAARRGGMPPHRLRAGERRLEAAS